MACPTHDRVLDYLARNLSTGDRDELEAHLDSCTDCRLLLGELARVPELETAFSTDPVLDGPTVVSLAGSEGERYELGEVLGRGGMGEVRLARDRRVEREVAVKVMHPGQQMERFVHEARLQGGLEHPAIVPVHDVGIDADGMPYFVMKRLVGTTLEELFRTHATPEARRQFLGKLVDVCLAVEFAHTRGVVHRDLKPANIMLGDFGEVYVLDWGVARTLVDRDDAEVTRPSGDPRVVTRAGAIVGTRGYMAPEQARGEPVDARADVYALGCLLFEILAGAPARGRGAPLVEADEHRPSDRADDVPPELDDLCARATANDRAARPTARELASKLQGYLDRDRDLARRRELAERHAELAEAALVATDRATAMREAGRALAVDPDSARAQALLARLLLEAPAETPAPARAAADAERAKVRQSLLVTGAWGYIALGLGIPILLVAPNHDRGLILAFALMPIVIGFMVVLVSRRPVQLRTPWYFVLLACNTLGLAMGGIVFGPLLVMPFAVIASLACWLSVPTGYPAWITVAGHVLAIVPVVILELCGVLPSTFAIVGHSLVLTPHAFEINPVSTTVLLSFAFAVEMAHTIFFIASSRRIYQTAQDRVHTHTWHLEQLLPKRAA
jgi:serine/threonine-protein kinase